MNSFPLTPETLGLYLYDDRKGGKTILNIYDYKESVENPIWGDCYYFECITVLTTSYLTKKLSKLNEFSKGCYIHQKCIPLGITYTGDFDINNYPELLL